MTDELNEKDHKYVYRYERNSDDSHNGGNWLAHAIVNRLKKRHVVDKDHVAIHNQMNHVTTKGADADGRIEPRFTDPNSFKTRFEKDRESADQENKRRNLAQKIVTNAFKAKQTSQANQADQASQTKASPTLKPVKPTATKVAPAKTGATKSAAGKVTTTTKTPVKKASVKKEIPVEPVKTEKPRVRVKAGTSKITEEIELVSEEIVDEAKEISQVGINTNPYGPKPLEPDKNIGFDIWKGNTEREKKIIALMRRNTVKYPDVAGNSDDVFSGTRQNRASFPVAPGQDVKNYNNWFNKGIDPAALSYEGPYVQEEYDAVGMDNRAGFYPITHHDLQKNWSVVHAAPVGAKRSTKGTTTIIHHPDNSLHYIHGGELKHDGKGTKDGSGFNVIVHSYNEKQPKGFVSNKKTLYGFTKVTNDELNAKEFKTREHAQNHVNLTQQFLAPDSYMSIHPKRDATKVKTERALHKKASNELVGAIKDATSRGVNIDDDMKVRLARAKIRKHRHPELY